ncbi:N-acetylmuramidase family protein [Ralstonia sp. CHL-2022]|uniref:N-acetylmuramidase family protein n=1 Tax=Ralstonia mojiangensis TaxID=2953895 RepID=A0AAE3I3D9_9RALS|nr:N-acetylmuramidase family protein [Ralstonia mojiangensis]MCT7316739.1 N-acetylmuramidase family protein [Ralstonia mojiangensis]
MTILREGMVGAAVLELQRLLSANGFNAPDTAVYCSDTAAAVRVAQIRFGLVVDGIAGPKTMAALQSGSRNIRHLTAADLQAAAEALDVPLAAVRAVNEVESLGNGFLPDGRPVILFERHIMHRQLARAGKDADALARQFPNLVNPKRGGYVGNAGEHMRLARAVQIDEDCALASASWGAFQIMGFHWNLLDYPSVQHFVASMRTSEAAQLDAFVRFVKADPTLLKALRARKWPTFARLYNGPAYEANLYDVKLARAFDRYQAEQEVAA